MRLLELFNTIHATKDPDQSLLDFALERIKTALWPDDDLCDELEESVEQLQFESIRIANIWETDAYSCRPYHDRTVYKHQLVEPRLCVSHVRATTRPCCRSFLKASSLQKSGDDVLGH